MVNYFNKIYILMKIYCSINTFNFGCVIGVIFRIPININIMLNYTVINFNIWLLKLQLYKKLSNRACFAFQTDS